MNLWHIAYSKRKKGWGKFNADGDDMFNDTLWCIFNKKIHVEE